MSSGTLIILVSTSLCNLLVITPSYLLYVTFKDVIEQMVRVLAKDLGTKGICVNGVAPGPTATELFFQGRSEELANRIASGNHFDRVGEPRIAYFSGECGAWVNG
ncbi:3-oxoacyl-[acyl-carrier-protein] reductase [Ascochyta rabiei]|uniref:3-oxoacyl-[acyl-carrier-protein] reductase n=1 Tax=Didymella rabiei TaxID=5454 RepID=UPI0021FB1689|nr:3-oxoacyl-[acyl-carrier-protein] reductase [Ascochyta rabiei]UPX12007.1 3-oxoacyl-[acyl-carrier-protein] reductase [Ascochyta rabiei]